MGSGGMLAFTMQICSNTTERVQLEHNTGFAFAYVRFLSARDTSECKTPCPT